MSKIIGIDLGTTNSCVAVMEGGEPVIIANAEGSRTTPSVVAFSKTGERMVGQIAKRQAVTNHERTVSSIKRKMGSSERITIDAHKYTPQEISAMILQKLKRDAEDYLGEPVTQAVITVPAYFTDAQRQATKDAGRIAGLEVKRIINEPTAAALAYGADREEAQKIMVYDLGGGTFDVSILDISGGVIEVLATAGNNHLGGDDFDNCVTDYLVRAFKQETGVNLQNDMAAMQRVREAAEKAKIELSSMSATTVSLPYIAVGKNGPLHMELPLTRAKFNDLTHHLVQATREPINQAINDSGILISQISKVLMVGGSSRIPAVQELVHSITGTLPFKGINPDECVALGACLQGGVLAGSVTGLLLLDVTPLSLGIETLGGVCTRIIERNTTLPIRKSQIFTTASSFQTSVDVHVLQGERPMAHQNKELGRFQLTGIRRAPRGVPQIEVTFSIDANGIVNVSATDLATGKAQQITITSTSNMSQAEIERAIRDAQQYAAQDAQLRAQAVAADRCEQLLYRASGAGKCLGKEDKNRVADAVKEVRRAVKTKDTAAMTASADVLERLLNDLHISAADPNSANIPTDDVMDAEFESVDK